MMPGSHPPQRMFLQEREEGSMDRQVPRYGDRTEPNYSSASLILFLGYLYRSFAFNILVVSGQKP